MWASSPRPAYADGFEFFASRVSSRQTRVVRQRRPGKPREFVATLRTASTQYVEQLMVGGGQVAIAGYLAEPNKRKAADVREFIAVARDGTLQFVHLGTITPPSGVCNDDAYLIDVTKNGAVIFATTWQEGLAGTCQVTRTHRETRSIDPHGSVKALSSYVGAWGTHRLSQSLPGISSSAWALEDSSVAWADDNHLLTGFPGGEIWLERLDSLAKIRMPYVLNKRILEFSDDGSMLSSRYAHMIPHTSLYPDPMAPANTKPLNRKRMISYFHFCGDKIVEIARRGRKLYQDRHVKWWRVSVRDLGGNWQRTLTRKLRRGTNFRGCDAQVARFTSPTGGRPVLELSPPAA
jgi:hypothetical protein